MREGILLSLTFAAILVCTTINPNVTFSSIAISNVGSDLSIKQQLSRFVGQSKFLNPFDSYHYRFNMTPLSENDLNNKSSVGVREIQESDVFKVGKENSKLLYLLNNYRGLQVISFENGANNPKILGRTESSGNWSQNMYYHQNSEKIISLENEDNSYSYKDRTFKHASKLIVSSVLNPNQPQIVQEIKMQGRIVDSRMVGEILYVATRYSENISSDSNSNNNNNNNSGSTQIVNRGKIYSFSLKAQDKVESVQEYNIKNPLAYGELMNIVEEKYHYYLLVALQNPSNSMSMSMMVIDISSSEGIIKPLLIADLKGTISERSQATIKDNFLVVVSNYRINNSIDNTTRLRIAVQAFKFAPPLTFIKKDLADKEIDVGSSDNLLNASIQDVRFVKNLIYVFWVPQNFIDPLDVFDISKLEEKISYKGRLTFDGWIQRSFPISYKGEDYIIGLGYTNINTNTNNNTSENNEQNKRYPQVVLFKILQQNSDVSTSIEKKVISSLTFSKASNLWVDFNSADKMIELRFDESSGVGSILFQAYRWGKEDYNIESGGKLIAVDINALNGLNGNNKNENFKEGGFILASNGWLKRVFHNPEIDKVNTFTNEELGTYDVSLNVGSSLGSKTVDVGDYNKIFKAINTLELARNIINYQVLINPFNPSNKIGIQIVSLRKSEKNYTELRFVKVKKADSDKSDIDTNEIIRIKESFLDLLKFDDSTLFILTEGYVSLITFNSKGEITFTEQKIPPSPSTPLINSNARIAQVSNGSNSELWIIFNNSIHKINTSIADTKTDSNFTIEKVSFSNCDYLLYPGDAQTKHDVNELELTILAGKPFWFYYENVQDPEDSKLNYKRNFLIPLYYNNKEWACQQRINIPGVPLRVEQDLLLTNDLSKKNEKNLVSLQLSIDFTISPKLVAILKDLYSAGKIINLSYYSNDSIKFLKSNDEHFLARMVFIEGDKDISTNTHSYWYERSYMFWPDFQNDLGKRYFINLLVDKNFNFIANSLTLSPLFGVNPKILTIFNLQNKSNHYIVFSSGNTRMAKKEIRVAKITDLDLNSNLDSLNRLQILSLTELGTKFELKKKNDHIDKYGYNYNYCYHKECSNINFTAFQNSMEIADGLYGIKQFYIEDIF
ncbi:MAG: beta-propeller domain-containing protein [Oligoflexia bacterium]|nr:beta-propeller domain-containing protein [Oligoflexia bacterium]